MKNIVIAGNCTKDAEERTTQKGTKLASFAIAVNGFSNGEKNTTFFDVTVFGARSQAVMQFAKKGAKMCVSGELETREYNGKTYLGVNASDFTPMGGGQSNAGEDYRDKQAQGLPAGADLDDEIPF